MTISPESSEAIKAHAIRDFPRECCGFVVVTHNGKELVVPCINSHSNPKEYVKVSGEEQYRVDQIGTKLAFYHSHPNSSAKLTDTDKSMCETMDLPWIVYAYPVDKWETYEPSGWTAPLVGRKFVYGVHDCYAVCRDHYKQVLNIELPWFDSVDGWWERGENLYVDNFEKAGFKQVQDLQVHDAILMTLKSIPINHAAIYLGKNIILHHSYGRLSCRAVYGGFWLRNTRMIVRHHSLCSTP